MRSYAWSSLWSESFSADVEAPFFSLCDLMSLLVRLFSSCMYCFFWKERVALLACKEWSFLRRQNKIAMLLNILVHLLPSCVVSFEQGEGLLSLQRNYRSFSYCALHSSVFFLFPSLGGFDLGVEGGRMESFISLFSTL